ncbi:DUF2232 domain-containing protein [Alicyclobacillus cycloheptanicus]|uniref:Uncharacterized protein YybS (DUF2232 family) n=1 Tax=Alicyclobacillus cycloheptanicus TaxID=1457 RepID=A0ABT9XKV1_9BACL|nr:DUF2232 domain-containing protein [Alicyclobacillus cycloheptanicus]MDQ0190930.1 uncharacterized protein YybS (DUF2232 family) [Alicyclobacillus cycloheptanicus]WDM02380.1 DUF2232 domain-containing protein [Alicyclobacillus cycloheptanicus]
MNQDTSYRRERLVAALISLILLGVSLLPGFNLMMLWLFPLPLIIFHVTGAKRVSTVVAVLFAGGFLLSGFGWSAVLVAVAMYFLSFAMGDALQGSDSPYAALITGTLVFVMLELVFLAFLRWAGIDLFQDLSRQISNSAALYQAFPGVGQQSLNTFVQQELQTIQLMLPGILCMFAFLAAAVNLLLVRLVLRRTCSWQSLLLNWRMPYSIVAVYMVSLAFVLFGWFRDSSFLWPAANNAMFLGGFFLGIQGLAFLWRRLHGRQLAYLWLTLLIGLSAFLGNLFVLLGLIDSMVRARRV